MYMTVIVTSCRCWFCIFYEAPMLQVELQTNIYMYHSRNQVYCNQATTGKRSSLHVHDCIHFTYHNLTEEPPIKDTLYKDTIPKPLYKGHVFLPQTTTFYTLSVFFTSKKSKPPYYSCKDKVAGPEVSFT